MRKRKSETGIESKEEKIDEKEKVNKYSQPTDTRILTTLLSICKSSEMAVKYDASLVFSDQHTALAL